jgi:hypothetical protein
MFAVSITNCGGSCIGVFHLNPNAIASTAFDPSSQLQVTTTVALSVRRACLLAPGLQFVHYLPYIGN